MCFFVKMKDTILNGEQFLYSYATTGAPSGNAFYVRLFKPEIRIAIASGKE